MKQEIDPKETNRAQAFEFWMKSPMPMLTFVKTFNVTRLYRKSRRGGLKFNMLLCWCIGKAASKVSEFYLIPEKDKLFKYDRLAVNVIVDNAEGGVSNCDIPYDDDLEKFASDYNRLTHESAVSCVQIADEEAAVIGTSSVVGTELDCVVNQYCGIFNNPFLAWGKYKRHCFKVTMAISFQFHHTQMDGGHAAQFLECLQQTMNEL